MSLKSVYDYVNTDFEYDQAKSKACLRQVNLIIRFMHRMLNAKTMHDLYLNFYHRKKWVDVFNFSLKASLDE